MLEKIIVLPIFIIIGMIFGPFIYLTHHAIPLEPKLFYTGILISNAFLLFFGITFKPSWFKIVTITIAVLIWIALGLIGLISADGSLIY